MMMILSLFIFVCRPLPNRIRKCESILFALCLLCELAWLYWLINDDQLFVSLIKYLLVLCILLPFDYWPRPKKLTFDGCFMDSFRRNYKASEEYTYFTEMKAYRQLEHYSEQTQCAICLDPFLPSQSRPKLKLLRCGHLFHKHCLRENEKYRWKAHSNRLRFPLAKCPHCRAFYDLKREKFRYDHTYWRSLHPLQRMSTQSGPTTYLRSLS